MFKKLKKLIRSKLGLDWKERYYKLYRRESKFKQEYIQLESDMEYYKKRSMQLHNKIKFCPECGKPVIRWGEYYLHESVCILRDNLLIHIENMGSPQDMIQEKIGDLDDIFA